MKLTTTIQNLVNSDHPTVVLPPSSGGQFQGWGTRIG